VSEHHNSASIVGSAPEVLMAALAATTSRIRIGSAGVMLPHYSALKVAEQFRVLEAIAPGRIDLGLGRAPGSDPVTARAMRRDLNSDAREFPQDVQELADYFSGASRQPVRAVPGSGLNVPLWILGSSLFGAQLAAALGLPFAFASHFAPAQMMQAIAIYRAQFRPSAQQGVSYVMLGFNVFAAESDAEAQFRATSMQQAFVNLRSGRPAQLPPPVDGYLDRVGPQERALLDNVLACSAIGSPPVVRASLRNFIERTGADELMIASQIYDHAARLRSYEITAHAAASL
jgi:luciferase family oxidoreductase group 1